MTFGYKADSLTFDEYKEITKINWFPETPEKSEKISFYYTHDGFLPDYSFYLSYDLPIDIKIDTINYVNGDFTKRRTFEIIGNIKRVVYSENQQ